MHNMPVQFLSIVLVIRFTTAYTERHARSLKRYCVFPKYIHARALKIQETKNVPEQFKGLGTTEKAKKQVE